MPKRTVSDHNVSKDMALESDSLTTASIKGNAVDDESQPTASSKPTPVKKAVSFGPEEETAGGEPDLEAAGSLPSADSRKAPGSLRPPGDLKRQNTTSSGRKPGLSRGLSAGNVLAMGGWGGGWLNVDSLKATDADGSGPPAGGQPAAKENKRPSFLRAMVRAGLRMPRNPETNHPYAFYGLFAPPDAFEKLGQGSGAHVKVLGYCFYCSILVVALALPLQYIANDPERSLEVGTAAAWKELTWGHVVLDALCIFLFLAFFSKTASILMNPSSIHIEQSLLAQKLM